MKESARWTSGISVVASGLAVFVVAIALVRFTGVPARPWLYIGIVAGILSAVGGLLLAVVRARDWSG